MKTRKEWKRLVLSLPDGEFFEIIRNYIGEVKTPFNKHELIDRLAVLLGRKEVRERISSLIDSADAELLSAIWFLKQPTMEDLTSFFGSGRPYLELHHHIVNLEQRLLALSDRTVQPVRIQLNPLLAETVLHKAVRSDYIFPPAGAADSPPPEPWISELLIISVLTYFADEKTLLKNDGGIKKRFLDEMRELFPVLFEEELCGRRLHLFFEILINSGLLRQVDSAFVSIPEAAESFRGMAGEQLQVRFAAKAVPPKLAGRFEGERILHALLDLLDTDRYYSFEIIKRAIRGICIRNELPLTNPEEIALRICSSGAVSPSAPGTPPDGVSGFRKTAPVTRKDAGGNFPEDEAKIVLQPAFSITVKPEISLAEGVLLMRAARITRFDRYSEFEITKESFTRGLKQGLSAGETVDQLEKLSGVPVPQNLKYTFETWENEYRSIALYRGIVLSADEDRRYLIEHDPGIRRFIRKTLAPGLYLLSEAEREQWEEAFINAGITPLPAVRDFGPRKPKLPAVTPPLPFGGDTAAPLPRFPAGSPSLPEGGKEIVRDFLTRIESMDITAEEREELEARVQKKLILFEEQLIPGVIRSQDKSEAKGIDYSGKVRIIQQAVQSKSDLLEVILRGTRGEPQRYLLRPTKIDQSGSELKLVGKALPDEKEMTLQIRKLSLVRRLKSSLFAP